MLLERLPLSHSTTVLLSLGIILLAGFLLTRITKRLKLPNVTGYILAGILIGPYALDLVPAGTIAGMDFVTDLALAMIAFGVGRYLKFSCMRESGMGVIVLTLFEALVAAAVVTLTMLFVFKLPLSICLLLGAIASATAPASTIMTIRQYNAKGPFVNKLLQVVALDDAVSIIAFSVCAAVATALSGSDAGMTASVVIKPVIYNLIGIAMGLLFGIALHKLLSERRTRDNRLILTIASIFFMAGVCSALDISPLLSCMALGATFANMRGEDENVFVQLDRFTPPILLLFFVRSGMQLNLPSLKTAGIIGVTYFFVRIAGKYLGAYLGALASKQEREVRDFFGLGLIPQAGVSIGLALLSQRILPPDMGTLLSTVILSSSVLYEMVGPACAKASLILSKSIDPEELAAHHHRGRQEKKKEAVSAALAPSEK